MGEPLSNGRFAFRNLQPLILASGSPRRRELLEGLGLSLLVEPSGVEEVATAGESPSRLVLGWAREKAEAVAQRLPDRWVLAADTIVVLDGIVFGKPQDRSEAIAMLRRLSGKTHSVLSGLCLMRRELNRIRAEVAQTEVRFKDLTLREIEAYVDTGEPMDKAGAYGIQAMGAFLVQSIRGSYTNVVGLPLCETVQWLIEEGIIEPCSDRAL